MESADPAGTGHDGRVLAAVGISELEERAYATLLDHPGSSATELAGLLGLTRRQAQKVLDALGADGLVSHAPERVARYLPAPPDVAVEALIARREEELERARLAAAQLAARARHAKAGDPAGEQLVEILTGREAASERVAQLQRGAQHEVLCLDRPPYASVTAPENDSELEGLARGVSHRAVYAREALEIPGRSAALRRAIEAGEHARASSRVPIKLLLIDRRFGLLPLDLDHVERGHLLVRQSSLLDALMMLFETVWDRAAPIPRSGADPAEEAPAPDFPADAGQLVPLLAAGLKDEAVARQLGCSKRTLDRRVQALMTGLDAGTRFQAGWLAALRLYPAPDQGPPRA